MNTLDLFEKYQSSVCKKLSISEGVYLQYILLVMNQKGNFDKKATYAGPGELGDKLVPDLWFSFAAYVHDALYEIIKIGDEDWLTQEKADEMFYALMLAIAGWNPFKRVMAYAYYKSVSVAGNPTGE